MLSTSLLGLNVSNGEQRQVPPRVRFSLRTKFICFISLIIIATCSGLSWYVIQKQADSLSRSLVNTGTILVKNLAHNSRYGLFVEDQTLLGRLMEGVMDVDEVVYVVITGPEGRLVAAKSKGALADPSTLRRSVATSFLPDPTVVQKVLQSGAEPKVVAVTSIAGPGGEHLYDFLSQVAMQDKPQPHISPFFLESE